MITGIVVALPEELSTLTKKKIGKGCCAKIADNLLVAYAGAGHENADNAARLLLNNGAQSLISWGCCAALEASLSPGDLALPEIFISTKRKKPFSVDTEWHNHAVKTLSEFVPVFTNKLLESDSLISSSHQKNGLFEKSGCSFLDMESATIARAATEAGVPFLAIRAVADPASMDLPDAINFALNQQGEVELKRLLLFLITHLNEIPALIRLGLHFKAAGNTLKQVANHISIITYFDHSPTSLELT